jgi:hypothetical protein
VNQVDRKWLCVCVAVCFTLNGCILANLEMERQVLLYSGDGVIHNASIIFWPGYRIEFPKFNSAKPYEASYRLSHVPQAGHDHAVIYLRFNQPDLDMADSRKKSVTASFRVTLYDKKGSVLHSAELHMSNSIWSQNQSLFGIYDRKKSYFHFKRYASYVMKVSYLPGDVPAPADELYFSIEEGGTK